MEDVNIPHPNPALRHILKSDEMRTLVKGKAEIAEALYRETVKKRSGELAASTHVETYIGGERGDRWCARMVVGFDGAPYAASHEFGTGDKPASTHRRHEAAAHDLNHVLDLLSFADQL